MSKLYAHKTMKQPNPEDLEYYIYKYSNYCMPRKINSKLRTARVDEIKKTYGRSYEY